MFKEKDLHYKPFAIAALATAVLGIAILLFSFYVGRNELFLFLNVDLGKVADVFFRYYTNAGDGWWWVLWLVVFIRQRKKLLPLLFSSFAFTTLFIQVCKHLILPGILRPLLAINAQSEIHYVPGVILHTTHSFPSGHTATAFTFLLLFSLLSKKVLPIIVAAVAALLVGYSRIYLGQHFPLDVGAGMIVASCSVFLALLVQRGFTKSSNPRVQQTVKEHSMKPLATE